MLGEGKMSRKSSADSTHIHGTEALHKILLRLGWVGLSNIVSVIKARWNNLRDNYRKSLKKNASRIAQSKRAKNYKYADLMNFLDDFFDERRPKSNQDDVKEEEDDSQLDVGMRDSTTEDGETSEIYAEPLTDLTEEGLQGGLPSGENTDIVGVQENPRKRKYPGHVFRHHAIYSKIPPDRLLDYRYHRRNEETHPVDAFLAGIAPTLKSFSPYYLNLAKSEIFASVQKYEMKMLEQLAFEENAGSSFLQSMTVMTPSTSHSTSTSPKDANRHDDPSERADFKYEHDDGSAVCEDN